MAAIAGIVRFDDRPPAPQTVRAMLATSHPRGASEIAIANLGSACIGSCGLACAVGSPDLLVTGDVRLDNASELRHSLRMAPDVELPDLLLSAYKTWGRVYPQHLLGDFAIAIVDLRERRVICARDHIGVRPLYYFHMPRQFLAFASTVRALRTLAELDARIDDATVVRFLATMCPEPQSTFYTNVLRLPPAHLLETSTNGLSLRRYWAPDPTKKVRYSSDREYADAFREIFSDAVRCRLSAPHHTAVTLSGGLDSSSVTCMAHHLAQDTPIKISAFSLVYSKMSGGDEREFISAVLRDNALDGNFTDPSDTSPLLHTAAFGFHNEGPALNPHESDAWGLYTHIAAQGIPVLLDGAGGDMTVYYGFYYLRELARHLQLVKVVRDARGLSQHYCDGQVSPTSLLASYCIGVPRSLAWLQRARYARRAEPAIGSHSLLSHRLMRKHEVAAQLYAERDLPTQLIHSAAHAHHLAHPTVSSALETAYKVSTALSIESRHPFFDKRLVEFCLGLPREQLVDRGWNRPIPRRALADLLPRTVRERGNKWSPAQSFAERLVRFERRTLEEVATDDDVLGEYLDMRRLRGAMDRYLGSGSISDARTIWPAVSLRQWLRSAAYESSAPQ
jgi:asparagine synthase (glutamine-hydrolysing)